MALEVRGAASATDAGDLADRSSVYVNPWLLS